MSAWGGVWPEGGVCLGGGGFAQGMYTSTPPVNRITDRSEDITFPQLHLRTVTRTHSSRMRTSRLPTVYVSVATTKCHYK